MPTATTFDPPEDARDRLATGANIAALRTEFRLLAGFLSALLLAMAARMFGLA